MPFHTLLLCPSIILTCSTFCSSIHLVLLVVSLEWTETDYSGSETSGLVQGFIRTSATIANPIQVIVCPLTYEEAMENAELTIPPNLPAMAIGEQLDVII